MCRINHRKNYIFQYHRQYRYTVTPSIFQDFFSCDPEKLLFVWLLSFVFYRPPVLLNVQTEDIKKYPPSAPGSLWSQWVKLSLWKRDGYISEVKFLLLLICLFKKNVPIFCCLSRCLRFSMNTQGNELNRLRCLFACSVCIVLAPDLLQELCKSVNSTIMSKI